MMSVPVVEIAPFRLAEGVDLDTVLAAAERLEREFLARQPGYLGRATTRSTDGRWMDVVLWADEASAKAILPLIPKSPACRAYFACMAEADVTDPAGGVEHLYALRTFGQLAVR